MRFELGVPIVGDSLANTFRRARPVLDAYGLFEQPAQALPGHCKLRILPRETKELVLKLDQEMNEYLLPQMLR